MKITDVELLTLRLPVVSERADSTQDAAIVRISTDNGLTGVGEADASPSVIRAIIEADRSHALSNGLRASLIGQDPMEIERLWRHMYESTTFFGRRGAAIMAISGVDLALYDLVGKALGTPAYQLLGGAKRHTVPVYASTLMPDSPTEAAESASVMAADGFTAMKFGWGGLGLDPDLDIALATAVREAVGDTVEIMLDIGFRWENSRHALQQAQKLEPLGIRWIEEPLSPDDIPGYRHLRSRSPIPIAAGEENTTHYEFRELLTNECLDIVQPDVSRCGGLTEARRIAFWADQYGVQCIPHAWSTGIVQAATLHLNAVLDGAPLLEYCVVDSPLNTRLVEHPIQVVDGVAHISRSPGLGVDLNEDVVTQFTYTV